MEFIFIMAVTSDKRTTISSPSIELPRGKFVFLFKKTLLCVDLRLPVIPRNKIAPIYALFTEINVLKFILCIY